MVVHDLGMFKVGVGGGDAKSSDNELINEAK